MQTAETITASPATVAATASFREIRATLGLGTQAAAAEHFGVTQAAVSLWERRRRPLPGYALRIVQLSAEMAELQAEIDKLRAGG